VGQGLFFPPSLPLHLSAPPPWKKIYLHLPDHWISSHEHTRVNSRERHRGTWSGERRGASSASQSERNARRRAADGSPPRLRHCTMQARDERAVCKAERASSRGGQGDGQPVKRSKPRGGHGDPTADVTNRLGNGHSFPRTSKCTKDGWLRSCNWLNDEHSLRLGCWRRKTKRFRSGAHSGTEGSSGTTEPSSQRKRRATARFTQP
jgi:hypothetical protein